MLPLLHSTLMVCDTAEKLPTSGALPKLMLGEVMVVQSLVSVAVTVIGITPLPFCSLKQTFPTLTLVQTRYVTAMFSVT